MKIYLAGPMRGIINNNYDNFKRAAKYLRSQGHEVFSPVDWDELYFPNGGANDPNFKFERAFMADLEYIMYSAQGIVLLPGWSRSTGVAVELALAKMLKLVVMDFEINSDFSRLFKVPGYVDGKA